MNDPTRREFLGGVGAFALFPPLSEEPDLILHNGTVITVELGLLLRREGS